MRTQYIFSVTCLMRNYSINKTYTAGTKAQAVQSFEQEMSPLYKRRKKKFEVKRICKAASNV